MLPGAAHAGQVVLQLSELDLELALGGVGVVGEDVEDHRGAVDHRNSELGLQVPLLARGELVVGGDQVGIGGGDLSLQLGQLAAAEVAVRVGLVAALNQLAGGRHPGGAQQLLQLGEGVPVGLGVADDPDRQRTLSRAGIDNAS